MMADDWFLIVIALILGVVLAGWAVFLLEKGRREVLQSRLHTLESESRQANEQLQQTRDELTRVQSENARLSERLHAERQLAAEKQETLMEAREQMSHQFKALSQEILEEKARAFNEASKASLEPLINPLREHIDRFEKQVRETYDAGNRQRSALAQQIRMLEDSNRAISEDAMNLATALRGESRTQGNWGEMILETVLERSGLAKGLQYDTQFAATSEDGRRQYPDAVVHLPESRTLIIDAKVSLTAYLRHQEADNDDDCRQALQAHIASVRRHLKELSSRKYQNLPSIRSLDYVFMFIPSEAAYIEALKGDFQLQEEAMAANVALVSPTTLMPMLRTVANLWRLDRQEKNAEAIAARAGMLHDKFIGFISDLDKVSRNLETVNKSLTEARRKLTDGQGNLVRQTEMLREMGANTAHRLPADWSQAGRQGEARAGMASNDDNKPPAQ